MPASVTNTNCVLALALAIGQLHQQSETAPSCTTDAVDAVAAHRCHELWSHTHIAE